MLAKACPQISRALPHRLRRGVRIAEGIARASCMLGSYSPQALDSDQKIHHVPLRKVHSISVRRVLGPPYGTRLASPVVPVVHARSAESRSTGSLGVSSFLVFDR